MVRRVFFAVIIIILIIVLASLFIAGGGDIPFEGGFFTIGATLTVDEGQGLARIIDLKQTVPLLQSGSPPLSFDASKVIRMEYTVFATTAPSVFVEILSGSSLSLRVREIGCAPDEDVCDRLLPSLPPYRIVPVSIGPASTDALVFQTDIPMEVLRNGLRPMTESVEITFHLELVYTVDGLQQRVAYDFPIIHLRWDV